MRVDRLIAWSRRINRGCYADYPLRYIGPTRVPNAWLLDELPLRFHVYHGVPVDDGEIDHVVLSSAGLLAMQSVDWTGFVGMGPNREVMHNGRSRLAETRDLLQRVMRLRTLLGLNQPDAPYIQAAFVITHAEMPRPIPWPRHVRLFHANHTTHYALKPSRDGSELSRRRVRQIARRIAALYR